MSWISSVAANLLLVYLIAVAAFATALAWTGRPWVAFAAAAAAVAYPAWTLVRHLARLTDLSGRIAGGDATAGSRLRPGIAGRLEANLAAMASTFRQQLAAAREEKDKLEAVLSGMVEGVLVLDREGMVRLSNRCVERLFGSPAGETLVGRQLISISRDPDLHALVRETMRDQGEQPREREIVLDGAGRESLQVTATAIGGSRGAAPLFILVFHDITELKKLEATRRDFVANVSHELRTPLTAIRGYAETLQAGGLKDPEQSVRFVEVIARHSERLSRLIDDLLVLSDLELGRTEIQLSPVSVSGAIEAAIEVVREKAEQRQVHIVRDLADTPMVLADADRIEQLLVNLVDNAVKYTSDGGSVTVRTRECGGPAEDVAPAPARNGHRAWVELSIVDTGIGIPRSELPRLTERFYRVDKARSRALGGTGLGLAIVKHIVQAHGGALRIESDFGKGTTVCVYLPAVGEGVSSS